MYVEICWTCRSFEWFVCSESKWSCRVPTQPPKIWTRIYSRRCKPYWFEGWFPQVHSVRNWFLWDILGVILSKNFPYLWPLKLKEFRNIVEDGEYHGGDEQHSFPRKMLQRMDDGKVAFNGDWHCDEHRSNSTNVSETEANWNNIMKEFFVVIVRERRKPKDSNANDKVDQIEWRKSCKNQCFHHLRKCLFPT